jgi:DeoR family suf operon transcriptional repressor
MQDTRQRILDYLKTHTEATVEELRDCLGGITAVTVRHHLDVLRRDGLVDAPTVERRDTPGRPRYVYTLTDKASAYFPKNYRTLIDYLIDELAAHLPEREVNRLFEGVARRIADDGPPPRDGETLEGRLKSIAAYLSGQGYVADYEADDGGYLLHTCNCPYDRAAGSEEVLCGMDLSLVEALSGVAPRRVAHITEGDHACSYFLPAPESTP